MIKTFLITLTVLMINNFNIGNSNIKYFELIEQAKIAYEKKDYRTSAKKYNQALRIFGKNSWDIDRYNAACAFALSNQVNASFKQLFILVEDKKYNDYDQMVQDPDLSTLHTDKRWREITTKVKLNKKNSEKNYNNYLIAELDTIFKNDQEPGMISDQLVKKFGIDSDEVNAYEVVIQEKMAENLAKVKKIITKYGWLGPDIIGERGNATLFLVIQHADLKTQLYYLPIIKEALKKGRVKPRDLAFLEDRIAIGKGEKQIYGSQITAKPGTRNLYVYPMINPVNVDKRRISVGLRPIAPYIKRRFGIIWNIEKHLKRIAEFEAK